jgi:hypothetical protein
MTVYCIPTTQELRCDAQLVLLDADADPYSPETKNWVNDTMGMLTGKAFDKIDFLEASKEPSTQLLCGRLNGGVYVAQVPYQHPLPVFLLEPIPDRNTPGGKHAVLHP